jgi:hypothetical protein
MAPREDCAIAGMFPVPKTTIARNRVMSFFMTASRKVEIKFEILEAVL